jgi:hypothetical protein
MLGTKTVVAVVTNSNTPAPPRACLGPNAAAAGPAAGEHHTEVPFPQCRQPFHRRSLGAGSAGDLRISDIDERLDACGTLLA